MNALLQAFHEAAATAGPGTTYDTADLAGFLGALYRRGRDAHPKLRASEDAFGRWLARCADGGPVRALDALAIEDIYLACACAEGVRGAAAIFENDYARIIRRAVSRVVAAGTDRDDAQQRVRQHLLVGTGAAGPAIARYPGQVPLARWIPVVAIRLTISLNRSEGVERKLRDKAGAEALGVDPEHLLMKEELRRAIEPAIAKAVGGLEKRDRLIFRLFLVGGMSVRAIGVSMGLTHQAVSKRLANARARLLDEIRERVAADLKIPEDEFSSLMRVVASQLHVNISRVLRKP
jgi:RNA polymerase sigma-70 factor (ECF subfamily)